MNVNHRETEATFEGELEHAAEQMSAIDQLRDAWRSLPPDVKQDIQRRGRLIWDMRGAYFARFMTVLNGLFAQNPEGWQQALLRDRAATAQQMARLAGQMARLPARGGTSSSLPTKHWRLDSGVTNTPNLCGPDVRGRSR